MRSAVLCWRDKSVASGLGADCGQIHQDSKSSSLNCRTKVKLLTLVGIFSPIRTIGRLLASQIAIFVIVQLFASGLNMEQENDSFFALLGLD